MNYNSISDFINEIDKDLDEINDFLNSFNTIDNIKDLLNIKHISLNSHLFSLLTLKRYLTKNKNNKLLKNKISNMYNSLEPEQVIYLDSNIQNKIVSNVDKFIEMDNSYYLKFLFTFLVIYNYDKEVLKMGKYFIKNKDKKMTKLFLDFLINKNQISNYLKAKKMYKNM